MLNAASFKWGFIWSSLQHCERGQAMREIFRFNIRIKNCRYFIKQMILLKYCSLRLWMNLEIKISLVWALFFFIFSQMLAAFSDANFARIPHAAHFISAAALVRVGLDPLSWKKEKKKQSINCCSVRGGGCFLLVQHTNHKSKTKQNNMKTIWSENIIHFIEVR